eukprot:m.47077 g.47077  ORF g.47077 m.47077 type:complete len:487 (+) comp15557_c0_seq1:362-1822(+)
MTCVANDASCVQALFQVGHGVSTNRAPSRIGTDHGWANAPSMMGPSPPGVSDSCWILGLPDEVLAAVFESMLATVVTDSLEHGLRGMASAPRAPGPMGRELITAIPRVCSRFRAVCKGLLKVHCLTFDWDGASTWARARREARLSRSAFALAVQPFRLVTGIDFRNCAELTIDIIDGMAESCPKVTSLNLTGCKQVHTAWLTKIARAFQGLREFKCGDCPLVDDVGLVDILENCRNLRTLHAPNCRRVLGKWLDVGRLGSIRHLCLHNCPYVTDGWLRELALCCPLLKSLDVSGSKLLSDAGVAFVLGHSARLSAIDFRSCSGVGNTALIGIEARAHPNLRDLVLAGCVKLTNEAFVSIAAACPNLRRLSLSGAANLNDEALLAIVRSCPHLRELQLCNAVRVTDTACRSIATHCPSLHRLSLFNCSAVTNDGVLLLVRGCRLLRWLDLRSCLWVTRECVKKVANSFPALEMPVRWEGNPLQLRSR